MMCSLKSSFCTNINKMTSGKRICEISIKDEGPNEPIVNAEVELRKSKRSRISKSFGQFHARKFWCTAELVGEALIIANYILNRVPHTTRNLILFHSNYSREGFLPTITSKYEGTLQKCQDHCVRRLSWNLKR